MSYALIKQHSAMDKKVFISSTFTDLTEYRESVQNGVRQLGI